MSLRDFMQQLQEQDNDVVYSKPPEETIQIIPPENNKNYTENIKIIPPQIEEEPQKIIRFKIKNNTNEPKPEVTADINKLPDTIVIPPKKQTNSQDVVKTSSQAPQDVVKTPPQQTNHQELPKVDVEKLFRESETDISKKERWLLYYNKALQSNKNTQLVQKMRRGRFRVKNDDEIIIEPANESISKIPPDVELLPEYITYNKSAREILEDKWLKKS